jgi:molybdopterin synthase catalytic subunit
VASFVGLVRADKLSRAGQRGVSAMTLEHYPGMTEKSLKAIIAEAGRRWRLQGVRVIHRFGRLLPGDRIVFRRGGQRHRGDAFAACEFIMDYLKTRAPSGKGRHPRRRALGGCPRGRRLGRGTLDDLASARAAA